MRYPTSTQLDDWVHAVVTANVAQYRARLGNAIDRERRGGSAIPDGYPTSTMPGSGGGSELTSVEAAVVARAHARDEHHDRTTMAVGYLEQVVLSLGALATTLDRIEAVAHHDRAPEPGCSNHAQHGLYETRWRSDLCRSCYDVNKKYGGLPTFKLLDDHSRGIRWTETAIIRALAEQRAQR